MENQIKKILITGGAGYIGNMLVKAIPDNIEVVVIDNFRIDTPHKRAYNEELKSKRAYTLIEQNVAEIETYKEHLKNVDAVVYMASLNSAKESLTDPLLYLQENALSVQKFLSGLAQYAPNIKKMIVTSTRGVYGEGSYLCEYCEARVYPEYAETLKCTKCRGTALKTQKSLETDQVLPISHYGLTKYVQESLIKLYCQERKIKLDIFRIFNVFGENQGEYYSAIGIIPQIFAQIADKKRMYLAGNGNITRDFVYVGDIVEVLLDSLNQKNKRNNLAEVYNLGSGNATSIADIAAVFKQLGYEFDKELIPHYGDIKYTVSNSTKVHKDFGKNNFVHINDYLKKEYQAL